MADKVRFELTEEMRLELIFKVSGVDVTGCGLVGLDLAGFARDASLINQ